MRQAPNCSSVQLAVGAMLWLAASGFQPAAFAQSAPADKRDAQSLADYLKRVGYYPVAGRQDDADELLLDGKLNDTKCRFLVDSGSSMTAVGQKAGREMKTIRELGIQLQDTTMGPLTNSDLVVVERLSLGAAQFLNQPAAVLDLEMDFVRSRSDALLGCDFLFRNHCLVDCAGAVLYVRGQAPTKEVTQALAKTLAASGFIEVPLAWTNGLVVGATANGKTMQLLLDTGAFCTIFDDSQVSRLRLNVVKLDHPTEATLIPEEMKFSIVGIGDIGAHTMRVAVLKSFAVGDKRLEKFHVGVANLRAWGVAERARALEHTQGFLGREFLRRGNALIDFHSGKLWLQREDRRPATKAAR